MMLTDIKCAINYTNTSQRFIKLIIFNIPHYIRKVNSLRKKMLTF